jgi:hypothetical protein
MTSIARRIEIYNQAAGLARDKLSQELTLTDPLAQRIDRLVKAAIRVGQTDPVAIAANVIVAIRSQREEEI